MVEEGLEKDSLPHQIGQWKKSHVKEIHWYQYEKKRSQMR